MLSGNTHFSNVLSRSLSLSATHCRTFRTQNEDYAVVILWFFPFAVLVLVFLLSFFSLIAFPHPSVSMCLCTCMIVVIIFAAVVDIVLRSRSFSLPHALFFSRDQYEKLVKYLFVCLFVSPLFHSSSIGCTFWERFCCSCWCCCCFAPLAIKFRHRIVFVFVVIVIRFSVIVASSIFHTNLILNPKRHIHGNAAMVHRFPFYHTMTVPAERSERKERNETKRNGTAWIQRRLQTNTKTHRHTVTGIVTGVQLFFDFSQCWFHLISVRFCVCVITLFCTLNFIEK